MRHTTVATIGILLALGAGACGGNGADGGGSANDEQSSSAVSRPEATTDAPAADGPKEQVLVKDFTFSPDTVEVAVGTTVEWRNEDAFLHTVTSGETDGPENKPDGMFDEPMNDKGDTASVTFDEAGTYTYYCKQHNAMNGTITVT